MIINTKIELNIGIIKIGRGSIIVTNNDSTSNFKSFVIETDYHFRNLESDQTIVFKNSKGVVYYSLRKAILKNLHRLI